MPAWSGGTERQEFLPFEKPLEFPVEQAESGEVGGGDVAAAERLLALKAPPGQLKKSEEAACLSVGPAEQDQAHAKRRCQEEKRDQDPKRNIHQSPQLSATGSFGRSGMFS